MGGPQISFPAGWALNLWLNCVETAQQCRLLFAAMEEECWHPLGHTCCVVPDSTGKKSLCRLPRTGPWTTCNTFPIYLFHCFFVLILTYFEKGKNNKRKGFFQQQVCGEWLHLIPQGWGWSCLYRGGSSSVWEVDDGWRCATLSGRCNEHHHLSLTRDHSKLGFNFQLQCDPPCSYWIVKK